MDQKAWELDSPMPNVTSPVDGTAHSQGLRDLDSKLFLTLLLLRRLCPCVCIRTILNPRHEIREIQQVEAQ